MPPQTVFVPEALIRDQRVMVGPTPNRTVDDVRRAWEAWGREHGFSIRRRMGDLSTDLRRSRKIVTAYVSDNCWTGDCPVCGGGVPTAPGFNDEGCCLDCGTIFPVAYPNPAELAAAVEALEARPAPNRHFFPHEGETAEKLRHQNIENGYHPTEKLDAADADVEALPASETIIADIVARHGGEGIEFLRRLGLDGDTKA